MPFLNLPDDNYLDDNYLDDDRPDEDDDAVHCDECGMNLDVDPCICGPAGPKIDGVWTGENARREGDKDETL